MRRLGREFFARPATQVAPDLVGKLLVSADGLVGRLVEAEAYMAHDPACHAYRGRTARNDPLWGPAGSAYVYLNYGIHWCLNTSTGEDGEGQGCLLRSAEPLDGLDVMRGRRGSARDRDLLRGPGRLGQAYGVDGSWSGHDLCAPQARLWLADDGCRPRLDRGPRVGVAAAADLPWRYWAAGSRFVSAYKRNPRAGGPVTADRRTGTPALRD